MAAADQGHPTCELVHSCLRDRGAPSGAREEKALFPAQSTHRDSTGWATLSLIHCCLGEKRHTDSCFSWVNHPRDKSENRSKKNIFLLSRGVNNTFFGLFWCLLYTTESTEETTASFVYISEFYLGPQPSEIKSLQLLFTSVVQELKQVNNRNVSLSFPVTSMSNTTWGDLPHL